jgi:hypothetical protein
MTMLLLTILVALLIYWMIWVKDNHDDDDF